MGAQKTNQQQLVQAAVNLQEQLEAVLSVDRKAVFESLFVQYCDEPGREHPESLAREMAENEMRGRFRDKLNAWISDFNTFSSHASITSVEPLENFDLNPEDDPLPNFRPAISAKKCRDAAIAAITELQNRPWKAAPTPARGQIIPHGEAKEWKDVTLTVKRKSITVSWGKGEKTFLLASVGLADGRAGGETRLGQPNVKYYLLTSLANGLGKIPVDSKERDKQKKQVSELRKWLVARICDLTDDPLRTDQRLDVIVAAFHVVHSDMEGAPNVKTTPSREISQSINHNTF